MRELRGAGPRGLAGLFAESRIARPLLETTRAEIAQYAAGDRTSFVIDPSNADRRHLRNRVRLDLLPAILRISPGFSASMLEIAEKAAAWRAQMEGIALTFPMMSDSDGSPAFDRRALRGFEADSLRCLWPALAARAGVVLDWRGTERLAEFTMKGHTGQQIQLSGGIGVHMDRKTLTFRQTVPHG
jgi:tRNA(Ile)-lysidine synthase